MPRSDALLNLAVSLIVLPPFIALGVWAYRSAPLANQTSLTWWRHLRWRIAAATLVVVCAGLIISFALAVLLATE